MLRIYDRFEPHERVRLRLRHHWTYTLPRLGLPNLTSCILVTDRRLIATRGLISVETDYIDLDQIEFRKVGQSVWGRVLGFGDIVVTGQGGRSLKFRGIAGLRTVMAALDGPNASGRPELVRRSSI